MGNPGDLPYADFLPLEGYAAASRKLLGKKKLQLVAGTPQDGYWAVLEEKKGTALYYVRPEGPEKQTDDFAAWVLSEAQALAAES